MPKQLLTIQTASPTGSIALTSDDKVVAELNLEVRQTPTEWLLPAIEYLLNTAGMKQSALDAVAVVTGPGAFTGLRVGIATAKGLAMSIGCPLLGISTLKSVAMQFPFVETPVCVMLDARKQEVYSALYRCESGLPVTEIAEHVARPEVILESLPSKTLFVGNGAAFYRPLIEERLGNNACFAPSFLNIPRAASVSLLARRELADGNASSPEQLMPNYLRPSEAELNFQMKKKTPNSS